MLAQSWAASSSVSFQLLLLPVFYRGNMVFKNIQVYDSRFGTYTCDNTLVPYAGNTTCTLDYEVTNVDMASGQPLQISATVQSPTLPFYPVENGTGSYMVNAMPVSVPVLSNPLLVANILAGNCTMPDPGMVGKCRDVDGT